MKELSKEDQERIDDGVTVTIGVNLKKVEETAHKEGFNEAIEEVTDKLNYIFMGVTEIQNPAAFLKIILHNLPSRK